MSVENILQQLADALGISTEDLARRLTQKSHNSFASVPLEEKVMLRNLVKDEVNERMNAEQAHLAPASRLLLKLGETYEETYASRFLRRSTSTLKRQRLSGELKPGVHYTYGGKRGILYVGYQIADILAFGIGGFDPEDGPCNPSPSGNTPSPSGAGGGIASGATGAQNASQWAHQTLK